MEEYFYIDENNKELSRIDIFLTEELHDLSRSRIQTLIKEGYFRVNGKKVKSNNILKLNDIISFNPPEIKELEILAENIKLDIIYEDSSLVVINKQKGMVVHPAPGHSTGTLVNALLFHFDTDLSGINGVLRPGIVHRIDKDTSGALVVAKNDKAHKMLSLQLAEHSMTRVYNAIVYNGMKEDTGIIDKPIARDSTDRKKMAISYRNSRKAITRYKVLERLGKYTLIEAQLETGRTHQIRVHMASIGHPLLGDYVYAKGLFKADGQVLHAKTIGFKHPDTNKYMEFNTKLPEYFTKLLETLRRK